MIRWALASLLLAAMAVGATRVLGQATPPHSILLVVNSAAPNPYGGYLAEILRAEGVSAFQSAEISALNSAALAGMRLVILAETPLTSAQAAVLNGYVANGGRLVAMRPDAQIASSLGLTPTGASTNDGYFSINTSSASGAGLPSLTLPFHGAADHYALEAGASVVATLYSDRSSATPHPAVVRFA